MSQHNQHQTPPVTNANYGAIGSMYDGTASISNDLGDIQEDEQLLAPLSTGSSHHIFEYGSHDGDNNAGETNDDNDDDDDDDSDSDGFDDDDYDYDEEEERIFSGVSREGFQFASTSMRMSTRNIMIHEQRTSHDEDFELVPTQLKNNVRMVEDVNLIDDAKGRLYLASYSFFNNGHDLKFALTVQPDIYERIMSELSDAFTVPCGLFFCCHGGDGAHTGVSHNDYVDIKLAWLFFLMVVGILLAIDSLED